MLATKDERFKPQTRLFPQRFACSPVVQSLIGEKTST